MTGASSGLGERFARVLDAVGATVVVTARRADRLAKLVDELSRGHSIVADLSIAEDRERLVEELIERVGGVDIVVNNAGLAHVASIEKETLDDFERVMAVNVTAVWHLTKLCGPSMIERGGGSVVNIASMMGVVASTPVKQANYCASKGAVVNMTRELAVQWARKGVRVNALCPGWFPSEMTAGMEGDVSSQRFIDTFSPMPRMGRSDELDGALLLLASPAGGFITGHCLMVDGGWTAR